MQGRCRQKQQDHLQMLLHVIRGDKNRRFITKKLENICFQAFFIDATGFEPATSTSRT